jgi:hypothetical protein
VSWSLWLESLTCPSNHRRCCYCPCNYREPQATKLVSPTHLIDALLICAVRLSAIVINAAKVIAATCLRIAEEAQESVLGPLRTADAGIVMVPVAEGLSGWGGCLRETGVIGRAEGLGKVEGCLRLSQFV